jgi:dephospho-CoA kinase
MNIGLTGSIGAGKSTVARLLRQRGLAVLDADAVARMVSGQQAVLTEVAAVLGPEYVGETGLERQKVAALVFNDPTARQKLNGIIHPRVRAEMQAQATALLAAGHQIVIQDIPLLFESGLEQLFEAVILVDAPLEARIERVMARDKSNEAAVRARDAVQMPANEKRRRAHHVIENTGDEQALVAQLDVVLAQLTGKTTAFGSVNHQ